jgi:hypothetical protein
MGKKALLVAAVAAVAFAASGLGAQNETGAETGAVVTGTSFSRSGTSETHYADCADPAGDQFRVEIPATVEEQLRDGQPCPDGPRELLPKDQYPELYEEMQRRQAYGGGDRHSANPECAEWETDNVDEARKWAEKCPPLLWGDLTGQTK